MKDRINEIIKVIMKVAREDYSTQIKFSGKNDELDALAMCINMMIDDIKRDITERKKAESELKALNQQLDAANQQLDASNQQLKASNQQLDSANQQLRASEEELNIVNYRLGERNKELTCLYGISEVVEKSGNSLDKIFKGILKVIPPAWQYPKDTYARITVQGKKYATGNFRKTKWIQTAKIKIKKKEIGLVEVAYLKKKPEADEGPFLKEERYLINIIAERLGKIIERIQAEKELIVANQQLDASNQQLNATNQQLKASNQQLKASEEKFRAIFEAVGDGIVYLDKQGKILEVNKSLYEITGVPKKKIVGKTSIAIVKEFLKPKDIPKILKRITTLMKGKPVKPFEVEYKDKILEITSHHSKNLQNRAVVIRDITEHKKAEDKLQESEASYRGIANSISDVFFAMDKDLRYIYWNKASEKQTGILAKDVIGKSIYEVFPDIKGSKVPKLFREVLKSKKPQYFINKYQLGGKNYTFEIRAYPSKDGISVLQKDITAQKQAEEALEKSAMEWQRTFDSTTDIISLISDEHRFLRVNKAGCESMGKTEKELIGKKCYEVVHRTDEPIKECPCIDAVKNKKEGEAEIEIDGRYYIITASPVVDENKKMSSFVHTVRDITERKQTEEELRLHSTIMTHMSERVYLIRMDDGIIVYTNPKFEEIFGYNPGEMIGKHVSIVNDPVDKHPDETAKEIMGILEKTGEWHGDIRNVRKDGTPFWNAANVTTLNHPEYGKVLISIHTDVTERKKMELEIKENLEDLEKFSDVAVGRELKMADMEQDIKKLKRQLKELKG